VTLSPFKSDNVRGVEGPKYTVAARCANPGCAKFTDHAHHMWRRSKVGNFAWVVFEGKLLANLTGLCWDCHRDVTGEIGGHRAAIRYHEPVECEGCENGWFTWCRVIRLIDGTTEYYEVGPLDPQPPDPDSLARRASGTHDPETCPFCGQTRRRPSRTATAHGSEGRRRKTWAVSVPDDEQETGADVLDALVEDLAPLLQLRVDASARYYVLVPALYYVQQHRREFIDSIAGVGA